MDSLDNPSSPLNLSPGFHLAPTDGNAAAAKHTYREIQRPGVCHPHFKDTNAKMGAGYQLHVFHHTQHLQLLPPSQKYPSQVLGTAVLAAKAKSKSQRSFGGISSICYRVPSISSQPSPSLTNLHKVLPLVGCLQSCGQTPARFLIPALCPRRKEETEMKTW